MNLSDGFILRLKALREGKGLNQEEFGALGGVKKGAQGLYETGKTSPTVDYLFNLSQHGINIAHLLTGQRADADPVDVGFLSEIAHEIKSVYDANDTPIGHVSLVQAAGGTYCDLAEEYDTIDECRSALRPIIKQLQRAFDGTLGSQLSSDNSDTGGPRITPL